MKTVVALPRAFPNGISFALNDHDFDVVARNIILLLIAFVAETAEQATDCMIHIWYSAAITAEHMTLLNGPVRQLVEEVCSKIAEKPSDALCGKTWYFGIQSVRVVLQKKQWMTLLAYFDAPAGLTLQGARSIRQAVTGK